MPKKILMTAALCTLTVPAFAADPIAQPQVDNTMQAPVMDTGSAWEGAYVGGALGYAWSDIEDTTFGGGDPEADGYFGTAFAGYNMDMDGVIVGIEGDVSAGHIQGSNADDGGFLDPIEQQFEGTLRGRVGADLNGFLPYLTGGVAVGNFRAEHEGTDDTASHTSVGYTVGGGVEAKLTQNVTARAEYRFSDYGTQNFDFGGGDVHEVETQTHAVRVGLGYQF